MLLSFPFAGEGIKGADGVSGSFTDGGWTPVDVFAIAVGLLIIGYTVGAYVLYRQRLSAILNRRNIVRDKQTELHSERGPYLIAAVTIAVMSWLLGMAAFKKGLLNEYGFGFHRGAGYHPGALATGRSHVSLDNDAVVYEPTEHPTLGGADAAPHNF